LQVWSSVPTQCQHFIPAKYVIRLAVGQEVRANSAVAVLGDQLSVPAEDGRRRGEHRQAFEEPAAEWLRLLGESTTLRVGESEAFEAEPPAQHPVFRDELVDLESLRALEPSGDDQDEEPVHLSEDSLRVLQTSLRL
jgi:hypothetical protein